MPKSGGREMSVWGFLARLFIAFCWGLLSEAAFIGVGLAYHMLSDNGLHDREAIFSLYLSALLAALIGLPFSIAFALWRLWRTLPD
jgi:hypothetical protein